MLRYILRRLLTAVVVLLIASIVIFFILRLAPGDPAASLAGPDADATTIDQIRKELGLDRSLLEQYLAWLAGVLRGDFGQSYLLHAPITELIGNSLFNTVLLALAALILAAIGAAVLGFAGGVVRSRGGAMTISGLTSLGIAVPTYVTGVLLILLFGVTFRVLPVGGMGPGLSDFSLGWQYLLLPALVLSIPTGATLARFFSASIRQVRDQDFIQTGIAKGLTSKRLMLAHVTPNAMPPVITVLGLQVGQLLGGAIIVETIFAWPGVGQLLLQAVNGRDYLLVQALLLIAVAVFIAIQLINDIIDAAMDPRIRMEFA